MDGKFIANDNIPQDGHLVPSTPLLHRINSAAKAAENLELLNRSDFQGDYNKTLQSITNDLLRTVQSSDSGFPVREDLEEYAKQIVPADTPLRNFLPRKIGSGTSHQWRQITSFGGGWGASYDQSGGGSAAQAFYSETGAPATVDSLYVNKTATYKKLGVIGSISNFAMAAGANFQNQLAMEKMNKLKNLMLLEEHALINGDSTSTAAPWGNGTTAYAFDGLINLVSVANGAASGNISTGVGALTLAHIDSQLNKVWKAGGSGLYMLMNAQEIQSLTNLAQASGSIRRVVTADPTELTLGARVGAYIHPISGERVQILPSRFVPAGTIIFGAKYLADGSPAAEVVVLPQVQSQAFPGADIQGYVAHDLAPAVASPDVYNFLVSVYEVLALKSVTVFAKSTNVSPA